MTLEDRLQIAKKTQSIWFVKKSYLHRNKELSIKYIRYRFLRPILKGYYQIFRFLNYPTPWIAPRATSILKRILTKDLIGLEFGSGVSSVFIAKRISKLVSVEHNEPWYKRVEDLLEKYELYNVDRRLIKPGQIKDLPQNPTKAEQREMKYGHSYFDYSNYSQMISEFADKHFDFVLIDGRARVDCFFNSIYKIKNGGFIILNGSSQIIGIFK